MSFLILDRFIPLPIDEFNKRSFAQVVVDKNGYPLRAFPDKQSVWRYPVKLSAVSPLYLQALINYEDKYYYQHFGVNPFALFRALGQWVWYGELVSGASTLTMQVARILKPHKKNMFGKMAQIFRALQLEWHFNKEQILTYYINYAPFGGTIEGVQAASYAYFGKHVGDITHSESALLAVLPQAPSRFRPDRFPKRAEKARNKLLTRLANYNVWDKQLIKEIKNEPIWAQYNTHPQIAPLLSRRLTKENPNLPIIETTIDINIQIELESLIKNYVELKSEKLSAALLLIDNETSSTIAYIGSADFRDQKRLGHVDMIPAVRSPGSTLKPFIYGMAIDQGLIHAESLLFDVPQSFNGYRPKNFNDFFNGPVSVSQALGRSLNMPAVQVLDQISPQSFYVKLKNSGLHIQLPTNAQANLSLALGGGGIKLQQLVGLFSALGNKGKASKPRLLLNDEIKRFPVLTEGSAWIIQNILSQVPIKKTRSRHFGSQYSIAYKTGTSYGFRDAWVLASNRKFTLGIWLGQADGSYLESNSGRSAAVPLLQQVLAVLPHDWMQSPKQPFNVATQKICWPLGVTISKQDEVNCHKIRTAMLLDGVAPPTFNDTLSNKFNAGLVTVLVDKETGSRVLPSCWNGVTDSKQVALWPRVLEPWLAKPFRRESLLPRYNDACKILYSDNKVMIKGVHDHAIIYPEVNSSQISSIQLQSQGSTGKNYWFVNSILQKSYTQLLNLDNLHVGNYRVSLVDDSGMYAEINFEVKL